MASAQSVAQTLVCSGYKSSDLAKIKLEYSLASLKASVPDRLKSVLPAVSNYHLRRIKLSYAAIPKAICLNFGLSFWFYDIFSG